MAGYTFFSLPYPFSAGREIVMCEMASVCGRVARSLVTVALTIESLAISRVT